MYIPIIIPIIPPSMYCPSPMNSNFKGSFSETFYFYTKTYFIDIYRSDSIDLMVEKPGNP